MADNLKKECIEFTEKILKGYRELNLHLSPTNKISKEVEEEVIRTLSKIEELEKEIEEERSLITKIDRAINNLSPIHREIIEYKYIEGLSWDEIIEKTKNTKNTTYSERSLKYKISEAVKSIAITLFGRKVFNEE